MTTDSESLQGQKDIAKQEVVKNYGKSPICTPESLHSLRFIAANVQDCDLQSLLYTTIHVINGVAALFSEPRYLLCS